MMAQQLKSHRHRCLWWRLLLKECGVYERVVLWAQASSLCFWCAFWRWWQGVQRLYDHRLDQWTFCTHMYELTRREEVCPICRVLRYWECLEKVVSMQTVMPNGTDIPSTPAKPLLTVASLGKSTSSGQFSRTLISKGFPKAFPWKIWHAETC
jgi:hypothetical protein